MVSIAIFSMSIAAFTALFSRSWKTNSYVFKEGQESSALSYAINGVVGNLRKTCQSGDGSYPIKSAAANDLVVFSDVDRDEKVEKVHYFYQNGNLQMGVSEPSGNPLSYPTGDTTVTTVASYIVNDASNPIFTYFNNNYPGDTANNPVPVPVTNTNIQNIRLIKIHLMMNMNPSQAPNNINFESFAELRNLNDYNN